MDEISEDKIIHGKHGWYAVDYSLPNDGNTVWKYLIHYQFLKDDIYSYAYCYSLADTKQLLRILSELGEPPASLLERENG